ncbi:hypothetical protein B0H13DRAFT_2300204 [Mycena leptocephala]|nr:hypothetical protein B0H13DRAFT_2300204 [Mycena leptocephala]
MEYAAARTTSRPSVIQESTPHIILATVVSTSHSAPSSKNRAPANPHCCPRCRLLTRWEVPDYQQKGVAWARSAHVCIISASCLAVPSHPRSLRSNLASDFESQLLEIVRDSSSLVAIQHCPTRSVQRFAPSRASGQFRAVHGRLKEYPASDGNGNSNGNGLHLYDGAAAGSVAATAPTRSTAITISTKSVPLLLFRRLTTISQYEPSTASPTWDSTAHWPIAHTHALAYHHQHQEPSMTSPTGTLPRTGPSRTHTRWRITRTTAAVAHLQSYLSLRSDASAHSAHALRTPHGAPPLAAPAAPSSPRMTHSPPTGRRSACSTPNRLPPSTYPPWLPLMLTLGLYALSPPLSLARLPLSTLHEPGSLRHACYARSGIVRTLNGWMDEFGRFPFAHYL